MGGLSVGVWKKIMREKEKVAPLFLRLFVGGVVLTFASIVYTSTMEFGYGYPIGPRPLEMVGCRRFPHWNVTCYGAPFPWLRNILGVVILRDGSFEGYELMVSGFALDVFTYALVCFVVILAGYLTRWKQQRDINVLQKAVSDSART